MDNNHATGSILALALADAFGAPFEGGPLERLLWMFLGKTKGKRRYTDDTQMTINVIESLIANRQVNQDDLARRFAASYRFSRGYGPGVSKVLKRINGGESWRQASHAVFSDGSFGNGAAMRAGVIGLYYANQGEDELCAAVSKVAVITHGHPLGIEGAILIALATSLSFKRFEVDVMVERLYKNAKTQEFADKLNRAQTLLLANEEVKAKVVARTLGNGIAAVDSVVTAIFIALKFRHQSFDQMLAFAIKVGGDVDTIAAMAGSIWGAWRGFDALPKNKLEQLENAGAIKQLAYLFAEEITY